VRLKLGIVVSQATVSTYMIRHRRPPSQTWRTFLANHVSQIVAADFFVVAIVTPDTSVSGFPQVNLDSERLPGH